MLILTVDDSPTMQGLIADALEYAGFDTIAASNGVEGLKVLQGESNIDLIISDVNMTIMGGFEFVSKVREIPSFAYTPILFLTTEASQNFKDIGREVGATGWLTKPFNPDGLVKTVRRLLP